MKTIAELTALIPVLADVMLDNPVYGTIIYNSQYECDYNWEHNYVTYEKDGWEISIYYRCTSDGERFFIEIDDFDLGEEDFSTEEVERVKKVIEKNLNQL